jgi:hypothetical protein
MAAPLASLSSQEYARVEDYLNDKLQSDEDLDSLDSLLQTLRTQHDLQRKQVCDRHPLTVTIIVLDIENSHCTAS